MMVALPALAYVFFVFIFLKRERTEVFGDAIAKAHIAFFTIIAVSTEFLTLFRAIDFSALSFLWSTVLISCAIPFFALARSSKSPSFKRRLRSFADFSLTNIIILAIVALIILITLATALLYPPNNLDSLTYHMPRVAYWIQNKSVDFYATANTRQNYQMPLAEFAILHFQLLSGSDFFANVVQWLCFCNSICLAWILAKELGGNKMSQLVSTVVVATLPMAILQSTSTQNDLVVSSFILSFALFMLRLRQERTKENVLFASLSLGLALLTKGTGFIYCAAIGLLLSIPILLGARSNIVTLWKTTGILMVVVLVALAINSGHFYRNIKLYRQVLPTESDYYWNKDLSVQVLLSNILRNTALHYGTPSKQLNYYIYQSMKFILRDELDNPDTTLPGTSFIIPFTAHEDAAGNPIHLSFAILSILAVFAMFRRKSVQVSWYVVSFLLAAILYCLCLKWQPWASRLHTPLFLLSAPIIGIGIASIAIKPKAVYYTAIICMMIYSAPFALTNSTRKIISHEWYSKERLELYFQNKRELFDDYKEAMQFVQLDRDIDVGLCIGGNDPEYLFWVLAVAYSGAQENFGFRHICVNNVSSSLQKDSSLPQYVLSTKNISNWKHINIYRTLFSTEYINVLKKVMNNKGM